MGNQQMGGDVQTIAPHKDEISSYDYSNDSQARRLALDPDLLARSPQVPITVITPPEEDNPTKNGYADEIPFAAAYKAKRRGSIASGEIHRVAIREKIDSRKDQAHLPNLRSVNPASSRINTLLGVPKPSSVRRGSIDTGESLLPSKSPTTQRSLSSSFQKSGSRSKLLEKLLSIPSRSIGDKSSDKLDKMEQNDSLNIPSTARQGRRASDGLVLATFAATAALKLTNLGSRNQLGTLEEGSGSERSDSSSARSKSESRNPLLRQASAPTSTSKRLARAKELIIPAFTSAGRRMRRPSTVDQGPIQIKLGRSDSSKSIEGSDSSPKIPTSEIYEPPAVAPIRARNRALTIANQNEARAEMEIATQRRAQTATKIPTVFKYTIPAEEESHKEKSSLKVSLMLRRRRSSATDERLRVWVTGTMTDWKCQEMVQPIGETEYCAIIDCPEGAVYYKFCVTHNNKDPPEWVVDPDQETVAATNSSSRVQANVINVKKTDNEVFAALTVDSFCVKNKSCEHLEEDRERDDNLWTRIKPKYDPKSIDKDKGPPILPPHLLKVLLNKEELNIHKINSRSDRVRLPEPTSHVMLNHLYAQSIRDNMLVLASTARYKKKSVTIVYYKDLSSPPEEDE